MKLDYDSNTDSLYIELSHKPSVESEEISEGVVADFDDEGKIRGLDIDHATIRLDLQKLILNKMPSEVCTVA